MGERSAPCLYAAMYSTTQLNIVHYDMYVPCVHRWASSCVSSSISAPCVPLHLSEMLDPKEHRELWMAVEIGRRKGSPKIVASQAERPSFYEVYLNRCCACVRSMQGPGSIDRTDVCRHG